MPAVKPHSTLFALLASAWLVAACGGESNVQPGAGGTGGDSAGGTGGKGGSGGGSATGGSGTGGSTGGKGGGGGSGGSSGGGSGGVTFANAPTELANAVCAKAFECCTEEELMAIAVVGSS